MARLSFGTGHKVSFSIIVVVAILLIAGIGQSHSRGDAPAGAAAATNETKKPDGGKLQYNRDVRPILAENCFACHGPDSAARKAGLRLDQRDAAIAKGALAPNKPAESELLVRMLLPDTDNGLMPPKKSHKKVTPAQKEIIRKWIEQGAEYQLHWSFLAAKRPETPAVQDKTWVRNPIDAFVLAELERNGLKPAPEADRRTLARRLSLDLTGLPPEPAEVEAFVNDKAPDYYEKYVDKLMNTAQWGEHRSRYWLDAARYADTHGIHFDNFREIWAYRDWVIRAFNENMPFDQFTIEQLAGDLLPNPTVDQLIATGFNRCHITTNEGGAIDEEYLVLYTRDRTETASQVYMGLTAGCAVCHDHKFDPLSTKEFYSMSAYFNNTTQNAMDGNIKNTPPVITVPLTEDRERIKTIGAEIAAAKTRLDARKAEAKADFEAWLKTAKSANYSAKPTTQGLVYHAPLTRGEGKAVVATVAGQERSSPFKSGYEWSVPRGDRKAFTIKQGDTVEYKDVADFDRTQPFTVSAWMTLAKAGVNGPAIARMDEGSDFRGWDVWIQNDRVSTHLVNTWPTDAVKVVAKTPLTPGKWTHVSIVHNGTGKASGTTIYYDGKPQPLEIETDTLKSTTRTTSPFRIGVRTKSRGIGIALEDLRIYDRSLSAIESQQLAGSNHALELLDKPDRTPKETEEIFVWWTGTQDKPSEELSAAYRKLQAEETAIRSRGTIAYVAAEKKTTPEAYVLFRGDYDKRRDKVGPGTPAVLPPLDPSLPKNRLGFAKWLLTAEHPLTARVTVNRFWQELYGNGLVRTSGDFGISGELPSHPELLDWMAVEFREKKWDIRSFFKMLVTSSTYRQAATVTKDKLEKDPQNRLMSRGPRFRMDGEMIRDYALAVSGLLVKKIGGPSVKPYQPEGVWEAVAMIGSNTRNYQRDSGEKLYRRSMYTFWKRAAPPASMEIFNAPNRETCAVKRDRTNTPIQALVTLNDVQFVEAARVLAEKTIAAAETDEARFDWLARKLLARSFRPEESKIVTASLVALLKDFTSKPEDAKKLISFGESKPDAKLDPARLAAWTMLCNQLLNLDEVLNK